MAPGQWRGAWKKEQGRALIVNTANSCISSLLFTLNPLPGDYNLLLLDQLLKFPELKLISCCNELNAGYV